jgi:hypothetical protein
MVTVGVVAAAVAVGELLFSLPASRYPTAAAEKVFSEALSRYAQREKDRQVQELVRVFEVKRMSHGLSYSAESYWSTLEVERQDAVKADLDAAEEASRAGVSYEFKEPETRVLMHFRSRAGGKHEH